MGERPYKPPVANSWLRHWPCPSSFIKVGDINGENIKLLKHVFALYSFPIIFSKIFLARYARSIAFYPSLRNENMQPLPTPFIYIYIFFVILGSLSLTDSFQNSLKTRVNCTKLRKQCPKIVCGGRGGKA